MLRVDSCRHPQRFSFSLHQLISKWACCAGRSRLQPYPLLRLWSQALVPFCLAGVSARGRPAAYGGQPAPRPGLAACSSCGRSRRCSARPATAAAAAAGSAAASGPTAVTAACAAGAAAAAAAAEAAAAGTAAAAGAAAAVAAQGVVAHPRAAAHPSQTGAPGCWDQPCAATARAGMSFSVRVFSRPPMSALV